MINRKKAKANSVINSTMILGDLATITQISRSGREVIIHGEGVSTVVLPNESSAAALWTALTDEARMAADQDRQFFCVSFGAADSESAAGTIH